jgi:hypothetical protein
VEGGEGTFCTTVGGVGSAHWGEIWCCMFGCSEFGRVIFEVKLIGAQFAASRKIGGIYGIRR